MKQFVSSTKFVRFFLLLVVCTFPSICLASDPLAGNWVANGSFIPVANFAAVITANGNEFDVSPSQTVLAQSIGCNLVQATTYLILTPLSGTTYSMAKFAPAPGVCNRISLGAENIVLSIAPDANSFVGCRESNPNDCTTFTRQGVSVLPPPPITGLTKKTVPAQPTVSVKGQSATVTCQASSEAFRYVATIQRRKAKAVTAISAKPKVVFGNLPVGEYSARCQMGFKIGKKKTASTKFGSVTGFQIK